MSNAFLRVFKKLDLYDRQKPFEGWFSRILIHASSDYYRYKKQETSDISIVEHHLSTDDDILDKMSYDEILSCVSDLTPKYRTVFNMYTIDGYKHNEIAELLSISEGTSKSNLSKAKKQLQKIIQKRYEIRLENK